MASALSQSGINLAGASVAANSNVAGAAIAGAANETGEALSANLTAVQDASGVSDAAIASNNNVVNEALDNSESETHDTLEAAQGLASAADSTASNLGGAAIAAGANLGAQAITAGSDAYAQASGLANGLEATSVDDLETSLNGVSALTQGQNALESSVVGQSINAVLTGQANTSSLIQSVVNSNTAALEQSNMASQNLAAGALQGAETVANNSTTGGYQPISGITAAGPSSKTLLMVGVAAVAVLAVVFIFRE
jgi:hypothetical protein